MKCFVIVEHIEIERTFSSEMAMRLFMLNIVAFKKHCKSEWICIENVSMEG